MGQNTTKKNPQENGQIDRIFFRLLPYYWHTSDDIPAGIGLILALNRWSSVFHACTDIALHLTSGKQARRLLRELNHMASWKGIEPDET